MLTIVGPALLAAALVLLATVLGIGVTPDATIYLDAARHLAAGGGFAFTDPCTLATGPVTHFPPLYPFLLSLGVRAGLSAEQSARILAMLLHAATTALVAAVVRRRAGDATGAVAGVLCATSLGLLEAHTAAWSEPVSLFLGVAGLTLVVQALGETGWRATLLGALALGLAAATRYVAATLVVTACLAHLFFGRRRLLGAVVTGLVGVVPLGLFVLRNTTLTGAPVDREVGFLAVGLDHLRSLLLVAGSWLVPGADRLPQLARFELVFVALGALLVAAVIGVGRPRRADDDRTLAVHRLFLVAYLGLFLVSKMFFDHFSPLDQRNLAPLFPSCLIIVAVGLRGPARLRAAAGGLLALGYLVAAGAAVHHLSQRGRGYLGPDWRYPEIFAALPAGAPVESNYPDGIYYLTGHAACARSPAGAAGIVYFQEPRKFTPRVAGGVAERGRGIDAARARAQAAGFTREIRERNATLFLR